MSALVTDQFRIENSANFVESVNDSDNSYYVWLGLPNPNLYTGFARNLNWKGSEGVTAGIVPNPIDNGSYLSQYKDTLLFGKRITSSNVKRIVKRVDWVKGKKYDMYRHDYSDVNLSTVSKTARLYNSEFYVINSDFNVYICISNGSGGKSNQANQSQYEPTFTDLEPSIAENGSDGYVWKYLFSISPSDIIKFDSTEYITLPDNWASNTNSSIVSVRENGNSDDNQNQIKTVFIDNDGAGYSSGEVNILGDGTGGRVFIEVNASGEITDATVTSGGSGYTYGIVDLGPLQPAGSISDPAKLIPIIPPSKGHGYDIYKELGADKVLVYARFDDSTRDFPTNTAFCQIGLIKNPSNVGSGQTFYGGEFSNLGAVMFDQVNEFVPQVGEKITQTVDATDTAKGYVASYDADTKVLKYFKDRSLFNSTSQDETDYIGISLGAKANVEFVNSGQNIIGETSGFSGSVANFTGITTSVNNSIINLGVDFTNGLATSEINKKTGDILYVDNRPLVFRNDRQKEDIKIILEF